VKVLRVLASERIEYVIVDDRFVVSLAQAASLRPAPPSAADGVDAITPEMVALKIDRLLALVNRRR
jgi:hypothetical protein